MPAPGTGLTYDLGSHLVDQVLVLFGRPSSVTAFIENIRGIGDARIDDCVSVVNLHIASGEMLLRGGSVHAVL